MKLSLMTYMLELSVLRSRPEDLPERIAAFEQVLGAACDAGFDQIDITGNTLRALGEDHAAALLGELGLRVSCLDCMAAFADPAVPEDVFLADVCADLALARRLGAPVMMLIPSSAPGTRETIGPVLKRRFALAVAAAEGTGVTCVFEDDPRINMPMCTAAELRAILEAVPGIKVVYDTANVLMVHEDPTDDYEQFAGETVHMHLKDLRRTEPGATFSAPSSRGVPYANSPHGKGEVDFQRFLNAAAAHGYAGSMALEYTIDPGVPYAEDFVRIHDWFTEMIEKAKAAARTE